MPNKKAKGVRAKTRDKLKKRGPKLSINKLLKELDVGQKVQISIDSSVHSAMPHHRYQGMIAEVAGKRGSCYEVFLKTGSLNKTLVVHPAHLKVMHSS